MSSHSKQNSHPPTKIYLWPNLMTAGNLCCGFFAILQVFAGMHGGPNEHYYTAILLILGACIFDGLDGRVARMSGGESPFGREFDSIADIVSFGVAPALLVHEVVLKDLPSQYENLGWLISFVYLLCGAMRLARFNCVAAENHQNASKDFQGFPIPAAAGVIGSLTLLLLKLENPDVPDAAPARWTIILPFLMVLLSFLMFSNWSYPSFKALNWKAKRSFSWVFVAVLVLVLTALFWWFMPAILFVSYLLYGLVRPWLSNRWRKEIEEDGIEDDDEHPALEEEESNSPPAI
ncbi:MAG: CDP-diacylglycerol--serine O-phosphatidyltransferase [Verrucomicrobiales bacterium]